MSRNNEFAKNTIILFIGKFATQFMSLLLLPLFTHYLLTEDYGYVDLLQTYISLFVPVLTLRLDSVTFRYLVDCRNDKDKQKKIISNIYSILFLVLIITFIISIILGLLLNLKYYIYIIVNIIVLMISGIFIQVLRGLGKNKNYSICSIITGVSNLIINILLIVVFKFGAESILISSIVSNILCIIYVCFDTKVLKQFKFKIDKELSKDMLKYSLPMIPNSLSWWVVNVSDRTVITFFLGTALNGIYTVSCKFSNILNSIFSIFNMSWQETTSVHIKDKDADIFLSEMMNKLIMLFGSLSLIILGLIPLAFNILIGKDYLSSYNFIPILLYANTWNVIIGLIGGIYIALKKTKEIASTTIFSAVINIIVHLVLIKYIGLYAACVSTLVSYMAMGIYRSIDVKKYLNIKLDIKKLLIYSFLFILSSIIYIYNNMILNIINLLIIVLFSIILNEEMIKSGFKTIKHKIGDKNISLINNMFKYMICIFMMIALTVMLAFIIIFNRALVIFLFIICALLLILIILYLLLFSKHKNKMITISVLIIEILIIVFALIISYMVYTSNKIKPIKSDNLNNYQLTINKDSIEI